MRFQKSQPAGAATLVPHSASTGPLKNMDASSPARKAHAHEMLWLSYVLNRLKLCLVSLRSFCWCLSDLFVVLFCRRPREARR